MENTEYTEEEIIRMIAEEIAELLINESVED